MEMETNLKLLNYLITMTFISSPFFFFFSSKKRGPSQPQSYLFLLIPICVCKGKSMVLRSVFRFVLSFG